MTIIHMKRMEYAIRFLNAVPDVETLHNLPADKRYGILDILAKMFAWAGTPQGFKYWCRRKNGVEPLSEEDLTFIKQEFLKAMSFV